MTQINLDTLPRTRKEAQALGSKHFFTGEPCNKCGEVHPRYAKGGACRRCQIERSRLKTRFCTAPEATCRNCGSQFTRQPRSGSQLFCSDRCTKENMARLKQESAKRNAKTRRASRKRWEGTKRSTTHGRLELNIRQRTRQAIRRHLKTGYASTKGLAAGDMDKLMAHLESRFQPGMSWDNYGLHGWHVDHIIPCASFDLTDPEQQKACFHYTNLQPLWAEDNLKKGARLAA